MSRTAPSRPGRWSAEWGVVAALWRRDMVHLVRERSRWLGVVLQPLLFWVLLGAGLGDAFRVEGLDDLDYLTFFFPGVLLMVVLFTTVFATMAVIEDRQHGFLQQLAVAPTSRLSMVLGKTAGVTTVAAVQLALCLVAAPMAGFQLAEVHWPGFLVSALLGCVSLTGISFTMAWLVQSTHAYHALMSMVLLPLWMVSGAMFPPGEGWLGGLMSANPMTYMVDGLRHGLHGGVAPISQVELGTAVWVLVVCAVLSLGLAVGAASRSNRWRP